MDFKALRGNEFNSSTAGFRLVSVVLSQTAAAESCPSGWGRDSLP